MRRLVTALAIAALVTSPLVSAVAHAADGDLLLTAAAAVRYDADCAGYQHNVSDAVFKPRLEKMKLVASKAITTATDKAIDTIIVQHGKDAYCHMASLKINWNGQ